MISIKRNFHTQKKQIHRVGKKYADADDFVYGRGIFNE